MTDNTTELDFGTTVQKATDAEKLPVVLLYVVTRLLFLKSHYRLVDSY